MTKTEFVAQDIKLLLSDFLVPLENMNDHITDCTYFLHKNGSFIFAEGYNQPDDHIIGNVIYYPDKNGHNNYYGHTYASMNKEFINNTLQRIPHDKQYEKHTTLDMNLIPHEKLPVYARYRMGFPKKDLVGFFEHKKALNKCCLTNSSIDKSITEIQKFMEIPRSRIGATGSLSFGIFSEVHDDIDIVWYGTISENRTIEKKIRALVTEEKHKVHEFGRFWPIRFYYNDVMFCSFFCYQNRTDSPLHDFSIKVIEDNIQGSAVVSDDTHGIYMPLFLGTEDMVINSKKYGPMNLIIYNGFLRGEYQNGDHLQFTGKLVDLTRKDKHNNIINEKAVLVTFYKDINLVTNTQEQ